MSRLRLGAASLVVLIVVVMAAMSGAGLLPSTERAPAPAGTTAICPSGGIGTSLSSSVPVPATRSGFHAAWVGQTGHATMCPGDTADLSVTYRNTGTATWVQGQAGAEARIGTQDPSPGWDRPSVLGGAAATGWFSDTRPARQSAATVAPGETTEFKFTVKAPATPGVYRLHVRALIEGVQWMEDYFVYFQVTVLNADGSATCPVANTNLGQALSGPANLPSGLPGFHAAWNGQSGHPTLCPGQSATLSITYRNSGTANWVRGQIGSAEARIGTQNPEPGWDRPSALGGISTGWPYTIRPAVQDKATVAPGQDGVFTFNIQAPTAPGVYRLHVRALIEGVQWMADHFAYFQVTVLKPDGTVSCTPPAAPAAVGGPGSLPTGVGGFHAAWNGQSGNPTLCPGQATKLRVTYRNVGTAAWVLGQVGSAEARLGTQGPEPGWDAPSVLGGISTGWPYTIRPAVQPAARVEPNQDAPFEFTIQAPARPGIYWVFVRPLVEGVAWMADRPIFWRVTVLNADGTEPKIACGTECWPLRGSALNGDAGRRGINVRIDNASAARPHYGISQADIIFESLIDSFNITRLSVMLHSQDPGTLGSVRSARLVDRYLTPMIRGGIAFAGSTDEEHALIRNDDATGRYMDLSFNTPGRGDAYRRVAFRVSPYNLFTSAADLRREMAEAIGASACRNCVEPVQIPRWGFLAEGVDHAPRAGGALGPSASNITVPNPSSAVVVNYQYQPGSRTYARFQGGVREVDAANGVAVNPRNVVVIHTDIWFTNIYEDNFSRPPEFRSRGLDMCLAKDADLWPGSFAGKPASCTGTGPATIFRDGVRIDGTWKRDSIFDAFTFISQYGETILLSPGLTWVHIIPHTWGVSSN